MFLCASLWLCVSVVGSYHQKQNAGQPDIMVDPHRKKVTSGLRCAAIGSVEENNDIRCA
jgi:hypothetical protein